MSSDLTSDSAKQPAHEGHPAAGAGHTFQYTHNLLNRILGLGAALALGALLIICAYQLPAAHTIDIGGYDAAYVQGFYDPEPAGAASLAGSDGSARWTQGTSDLLLPQVGLPAQVTLRLRGRSDTPPTELTVLLNGGQELARIHAGSAWAEQQLTIDGGLLKPNDVVIELRADTAPLSDSDTRTVGVLLDRASYRTSAWPILPYPAQVAYGALAALLLAALLGDYAAATRRWLFGGLLLALGAAFLLLYRIQPLYPYPLRMLLPGVDMALAALLALRHGPALLQRAPALPDILSLGGVGAWLAALLLAARDHVTLSVPGVENDFGVFARRSAQLFGTYQTSGDYPTAVDGVLRADGFYNIAYPLLLWLTRPLFHNNTFLAARLLAALSAALLLLAAWWLARQALGRAPALLALLILALNPLVVEYGLYVGTDMLFAACCTLTLALLYAARTRPAGRARWALIVLAGACTGATFMVRHPGILLLPIGWLALWLVPRPALGAAPQHLRALLVFSAAFLLASAPQLFINLRDTGQPLYSQQAKNIWLCVYASCDWSRWQEAPNSIAMSEVVLRDPGRFLANWWANLLGFLGSGAEDTSEFGHAIQLRLLGFPANWLAIGGLLAWLFLLLRRERERMPAHAWLLLLWVALNALTLTVGLALIRFSLALAPVYAIAAAWTLTALISAIWPRAQPQPIWAPLARLLQAGPRRATLLAALLLLLCLWPGLAIGEQVVLGNQPADEIAAVQLVRSTLRPDDRLIVQIAARRTLGQFSAIAHLITPANGQYLLSQGGAAPAHGRAVGSAGPFTLYHLEP